MNIDDFNAMITETGKMKKLNVFCNEEDDNRSIFVMLEKNPIMDEDGVPTVELYMARYIKFSALSQELQEMIKEELKK